MLCRPKEQGGLGILDLQLQNKCLYVANTDGMWQTLLQNKYLRSKSLTQVAAKPYGSHFWRGLMHKKDEVLAKGSFEIKDGTNVRFWDDTWVGDKPLKVQYPNLYNIVRDPHANVSKIMATIPLNISFRRALVDNKLRDWLSLVAQISHVELTDDSDYFKWSLNRELTDDSDYFKWSLNRSDLYTVRSLYHHLIDTQPPFHHRKIWKMRIPLKIKTFL
jgi:hypothetical protein